MTLQKAAEALRELAQSSEHRSKIGRLRSVYAEVLEAQRAGVSNSKIVETLNAQGFGLTIKTFETMLYRIRREQAKATSNAERVHAPVSEKPATHGPRVHAAGTADSPAASPQDSTPRKEEKPEGPKITNPAEVRKSRARKIDLDDYKE